MSALVRYRRNTAILPLVPLFLVLVAYMGWSFLRSDRPEPYDTYGRELPALTAPAATPFDDPALPYTFTLPAGLIAMPDTGGADVRLAPEAWFPTDAAVRVATETLKASTEGMSDKERIAVVREADSGPGPDDEVTPAVAGDGSPVLLWPGCCETPAPLVAWVFHGKQVAVVTVDPPDDGEDATGALDAAARELIKSFAWR